MKGKTEITSHDKTLKDSRKGKEYHAAAFPQADIVYQKGWMTQR